MFKAHPEISPKQDDVVAHGEISTPQLSATIRQDLSFPLPNSQKLFHTNEERARTIYRSLETAEGLQTVNIGDLTGDDIVIAVMGPPGSGKSTFIRAASGLDAAEVDDVSELSPSYATATKFWDHASKRHVVLVDTPSFDDMFDSSLDVSNMTLHWLISSNNKKIHLTAILYLHRITDNRVASTSLKNLKIFERLCGKNSLDKVNFVTTMWDEIEPSIGEKRLTVLGTEFWKAMIDQGAKIDRCRSDDDSPQRLIRQIVLFPQHSRRQTALGQIISARISLPGWKHPYTRRQSEEVTQAFSQFAKEARIAGINDLEADDIVIAIMGPTDEHSGKETFIHSASGLDIGKWHNSVVPVRYLDQASMRHVVLVYLPGFDDTFKSDFEALVIIAEWLIASYNKKIYISGIIYLHRITDNRMAGSSLKNLRIFRKLCGKDALDKVYITTTMWDEVEPSVGERRLEELRTEYWKTMIALGAQIARCRGNDDSPQQLIRRIVALGVRRKALLIQMEMTESKKELRETAAGQQLYSQLELLVEKQLDLLRRIDKEKKAVSDPEIVEDLQTEYHDLRAQIDDKLRQMQQLRLPTLKRFFSRRRD